jgi:hypothetical protein
MESFSEYFHTPLDPARWAALAGVPVALIALYFLKLKRRPERVPSTLLWRRSMEDLHVNSLFQRLRRNLLLFLQLLIIFLAMFALAGPRSKGFFNERQKYVIVIDNSASMSATDAGKTRLELAKAEARKVVDGMNASDLAMIISFNDRAKVEASYTSNKSVLRGAIERVAASEGSTSPREALEVAAGLANPSRQFEEGTVATAEVPPKLVMLTDGGFDDVEGFSLGNLQASIVVVGKPPRATRKAEADNPPPVEGKPLPNPSDNVAIAALQTRRDDEKTDRFQIFGRIHNYREESASIEAKLYKHDSAKPTSPGSLLDAIALEIAAQADQSFKFDLPGSGAAEFEVRIDVKDAQPLDNRAFAVVSEPRRSKVLIVSSGDRYLIDTLKTPVTLQEADFTVVKPEEYDKSPVDRQVAGGEFDWIIYENFRPKQAPEADALYFGAFPPGAVYDNPKSLEHPVILDWDTTHPLMQFIRDLSTVFIQKAKGIEPPPGTTPLIGSNLGTLAFVVPRSGYRDVVVSFPLVEGTEFNTNWPLKISFPLFLYNCLNVLGDPTTNASDRVHVPGRPVILRVGSLVDRIEVTAPDGSRSTVKRSTQGTFIYNQADRSGIYYVNRGENDREAFAVNLFDPRESDIATRGLVPEGVPAAEAERYRIKIGYNPVEGKRIGTTRERSEWWPWLAAGALAIVMLEWYIYNKKVYI